MGSDGDLQQPGLTEGDANRIPAAARASDLSQWCSHVFKPVCKESEKEPRVWNGDKQSFHTEDSELLVTPGAPEKAPGLHKAVRKPRVELNLCFPGMETEAQRRRDSPRVTQLGTDPELDQDISYQSYSTKVSPHTTLTASTGWGLEVGKGHPAGILSRVQPPAPVRA